LMETINSERSFLKTDRLQKKIISACKQSLKFRTPILNPTTQFNALIHSSGFSGFQKFIAYVSLDEIQHLINLALPKNKYLLLIGPEGDFDQKEIKEALDAGFRAVSLGKSRLRTETAGLSGVHILQLVNEK